MIISCDTETEKIGPQELAPKMICATFAWQEQDHPDTIESTLCGNAPKDNFEGRFCTMLAADHTIVTHKGGYDYCVIMASYPDLIPVIFDAIIAGKCTDTICREKLLNLSNTGNLKVLRLPNGATAHIGYSLNDLGMQYGLEDRTEDKEAEDGWRLNYHTLDGYKSDDYPDDAKAYALRDAEATLLVYLGQEARKQAQPHLSTETEAFQLAASVALQLMSCWGMQVNKAGVAEMRRKVYAVLEANEAGLVEAGILLPSAPERAKKNGNGTVKAKAAKINTKPLQERAAKLFKQLGKMPSMTAGGTREPKIQLDEEVVSMLALHDPVFLEYSNRQHLSKLFTGQIPVLESGDVIHFNYDELVETGRTSSFGTKKGRKALYPCTNGQNVPKEIEGIDVRADAYQPREGTVFFDVDVSGLELACVGQQTYTLFGESVHLDRYNEGVDLHGYLAASLICQVGTDGVAREFVQACRDEGVLTDPVARYDAFMECKTHSEEAVRKMFKHWRTFAKPVGLGFPGGLGPATMIDFAWATYEVRMTEKQASEAREVWRQTYPEMVRYFKWVESQVDEYNSGSGERLHQYVTPLGMVRRGATFCSVANGFAMQSPGAEAMKMALIPLARECYDATQQSVLFGCRPIAFVHDQVIGETTAGDGVLWHDQCMRVAEIICDTAKIVLPDVKLRCDEAHLTSVWSKRSVPTFGPDGRLIPWVPK